MMCRSAKTVFFIVLGLSLTLFFFRLGDRSFRNPDEGRYAEIAKEMVQSGNWVQPRLYGVNYLRKPVLFYWLVAASFKVFGFSEFAARLVPALFGIFGVLATFFFTRRVFDLKTAFYAALILVTNVLYLGIGRYLLIDSVFSFFLMSALYLFYLAVNEEKNKTRNYLLFYVSLSLSFLTKGPAAVAIMGLAGASYVLVAKKWKAVLFEMQLIPGLLVFAGIVVPWFYQISLRQPDFLNFFFLHEHIERFVSQHFEHQEEWYYYFVLTPLIFIPWIFFPKLKTAINKNSVELFLLIASAAVVLFYSLSRSKLATYVLPSLPFISVWIARCWVLSETKTLGDRVGRVFASVVVALCVVCLSISFAMEKVNPDYTTKPFAEFLKPELEKNDTVFIYDHPGALYDFRYYLNFPVKLVGLEGELELFRSDLNAKEVSVTKEAFEVILKSGKRVFCLMRKSDYEGLDAAVRARLSLIKEDNRKVLVVSRS